MIEFTKQEKIYIKEQILKEVFNICVRLYGLDPNIKVEEAGIDIRVRWNKGYRKDKVNIYSNAQKFSSAILPHLNYAIPYDWRKRYKGVEPLNNKYNEFGFYYMSTLEHDRNDKLQELLK